MSTYRASRIEKLPKIENNRTRVSKIDTGLSQEAKKKLAQKSGDRHRKGDGKSKKASQSPKASKVKQFDLKNYAEDTILGHGCYGEMVLANLDMRGQDTYGYKTRVLIQILGNKPRHDLDVEKEFSFLRLSHPNISKCYGYTQVEKDLVSVLQPVTDTVHDALYKLDILELHDIKHLGEQLLQALSYLAKHKIYNQNICPRNLLLLGPPDSLSLRFMTKSQIQLCQYRLLVSDFAPINPSLDEEVLEEFRETKYRAPELKKANIKNRRPTSSTDIYSAGMVLLDMAAGEDNELYNKSKGKMNPDKLGHQLGCKSLGHSIASMVKMDPGPRMSADNALERDFFAHSPLVLTRNKDVIQSLCKHGDHMFMATQNGLILKLYPDTEEIQMAMRVTPFTNRLVGEDEEDEEAIHYYEDSEDPQGISALCCNDHFLAHLDFMPSKCVFVRKTQDLHESVRIELDYKPDDIKMNDKFMFIMSRAGAFVELHTAGRSSSYMDVQIYERIELDDMPDYHLWTFHLLDCGNTNFLAVHGASVSPPKEDEPVPEHDPVPVITHCSLSEDRETTYKKELDRLKANKVFPGPICSSDLPDEFWVTCRITGSIYRCDVNSGEEIDRVDLELHNVVALAYVKSRYVLALCQNIYSLMAIDTRAEDPVALRTILLQPKKPDIPGVAVLGDGHGILPVNNKIFVPQADKHVTSLHVVRADHINKKILERKIRLEEKEEGR